MLLFCASFKKSPSCPIIKSAPITKNIKTKIEIKKARLNSILPTLSPLSNSITEDTVSLKKYISFVEENIIKKYNLDSVASLSLQNISYGKKG